VDQRAIAVGCWLFVSSISLGADSALLGAIEGTVTYQADAGRPWRYARYYVKQAKTGELAEAVVALKAQRQADSQRVPQTVIIDQLNFQFQPETVAIRRGDSVKFTNGDGATHNVQASSDIATFNVTMPYGGEETVRFDRAGGTREPVQVGCVFHSAMRAFIFVFDHPWFQVTAADGRFRLVGIPPGEYDLEMVHPAGGLRTVRRVVVKPNETLRVDIRVSPDDKK
jgi:plastocyanin